MKKAIIVTRERNEGSIGSRQQTLDAQVRVIDEFANRHGLEIVDRIVEAGISADELCDKVTAYLRGRHDVAAIITYSADRLCRDLCVFDKLSNLIMDQGIEPFFACGNGGSAVSISRVLANRAAQHPSQEIVIEKLLHQIKLPVAKHYVGNPPEELQKGTIAKAEQDIRSSYVATGDRIVQLPSGQNGIVPDAHTAWLIRRLFTLYATGLYRRL